MVGRSPSTGIVSTIEKYENRRKYDDDDDDDDNDDDDDDLLLVVQEGILGHIVKALVVSDATRCLISTSAVFPLELSSLKDYSFLEPRDRRKTLHKGKSLDVPIITVDVTTRMELTIASLLHEVDVI